MVKETNSLHARGKKQLVADGDNKNDEIFVKILQVSLIHPKFMILTFIVNFSKSKKIIELRLFSVKMNIYE